MKWEELDFLKLTELRDAIVKRIKQYETIRGPKPTYCSLCRIYLDSKEKHHACPGCPASVRVRSPHDRRYKKSICSIYVNTFDHEVVLKFLKEQRDKIDTLIEDLRQNNNSVGHESSDSLMEE